MIIVLIKKSVKQVVRVSELKQSSQEIKKEDSIESRVPVKDTIENELLDRLNIIESQQTLLEKAADNSLSDQIVLLDPIHDKEVIQQLDDIRNSQVVSVEEDKGYLESTYAALSPDTTVQQSTISPDTTVQQSTKRYKASPYAIYYDDYIAQTKVVEYIQPTQEKLSNFTYSDGNKDYSNDYTDLSVPDLKQCVDSGTWKDKLFWKLIITEDRGWDLTYLLIFFVLGPLERFFNWFLHKLKSVKIVGWYPFDWIKYTYFCELFQYKIATKYASMFCGVTVFFKNYKGDDYGLQQFLSEYRRGKI